LTSSKESSLQHITECTESENKVRLPKPPSSIPKKGGKLIKYWECNQCHQEVNQLTGRNIGSENLCLGCRSCSNRRPISSSEVEFVDALLEESEFQNSIFVAHNSGSYDIHFRNVKFLDFIRFMPVAKGDFPHRFNNGCHDSYVGRIPAIDSEHDYWGLKEVRSKKQKEELNKWYQLQCEVYCNCPQQCTCNKKKWDFQEEIRKYCRDKVKTYRSELNQDFPDSSVEWHVPCVDPLIRGYRESSFHDQGFKGIVSLVKTTCSF